MDLAREPVNALCGHNGKWQGAESVVRLVSSMQQWSAPIAVRKGSSLELASKGFFMTLSTDVNLPRTHRAVFPDECLICGRVVPGARLRLFTSTLGWWTVIFWWYGKPFMVTVPACRRCGLRHHARSAIGVLISLAAVLVVYYFVWPYLEDLVPRSLQRWVVMLLTLVCLIPYFVFETVCARPIAITAYAGSVDYQFASRRRAVNFALINRDAEWVRVDGHTIDELLAK